MPESLSRTLLGFDVIDVEIDCRALRLWPISSTGSHRFGKTTPCRASSG